jgi:hypothetical protein
MQFLSPLHIVTVIAIDGGAWWALEGEAAIDVSKKTVSGYKGGS